MAGSKAASLRDSQYALQGDDVQQQRQNDESHSALNDAPTQPSTTFKVFKLSDTNKKGRYHLDGVDDIWNPELKKMERIRLLRGHPSIKLSEQKDADAVFVASNKRSLTFDTRVLRIPDWDTTAIEFLQKNNANLDNPNRKGTRRLTFFEWNPLRQAEIERQRRTNKIEAIKLATLASDESMKKHANYLGINAIDEMGFPKSIEALRNDYELYAEAQPTRFMQSAGSKEVEVAYVVKRAILDTKIDLTARPGSAYWSNDGGFICKIPSDQDAQEYLVEYAMLPNDDSKQFMAQLRKLE